MKLGIMKFKSNLNILIFKFYNLYLFFILKNIIIIIIIKIKKIFNKNGKNPF